ncbi:MAG: hypothetical protein FWH16_02690 [Oscillospiraceae bacterium]|nr:hypothetical protein [Oscillospiraceae bacterium]
MRERLKSYTIVILFMSLVWLAMMNWFYWSDVRLDAEAEGAETPGRVAVIDAARPVAGDFDSYRVHLGELFAAADTRMEISRREWDAALADGGVYFRFLCPTPAWLVAEGLSFEESDIFGGVEVFEMILSEDGLFVFDGGGYTHFSAPLPVVLPERAAAGGDNGALVSYAVTSSRFMEEPYLSELLESLAFNPNTNFRYTQTDGEMVVVDDARTLHINPNGRVVYLDATSYDDEPVTNEREAVRLCLGMTPRGDAFWGDGQLVFNSVESLDGELSLALTYVLNGAAFLDWQTVFTVRSGILREAVIYLAPAALSGEMVRLMPRERAESLLPPGRRVCVGYSAVGGGVWAPDWYGY